MTKIPTWKPIDGPAIPVTEMTDLHLSNARSYVEREMAKNSGPDHTVCSSSSPGLEPVPCYGCDQDALRKKRRIELILMRKTLREEMERRAALPENSTLTLEESSGVLGLSVDRLVALLHSGELAYEYRISRSEIKAYQDRKRAERK